MPIYEYQCQACGERHDALQKFSDGPLRKCPACGKLKLKKLVSAAAFHLKGSGWYVTDFRDNNKGKPKDKSDGDGAETKSAGGDDKKTDAKSESKTSDKKADTKSESKKKDTKPGSSASA